MNPKKHYQVWTEEEIEYLISHAGKWSIEKIAQKLGRTYNATVVKAERLGVANGRLCTNLYTAYQISKLMGVASTTVLGWTKIGLKYKVMKFRTTYEFKMIDINDFYEWGEQHQELIDTRKIKIPNLGDEPTWLKEKRKSDLLLPKKQEKFWSTEEENQLIKMYEQGLDRDSIAQKLQRTSWGVKRKIDKLKALGYLPIEKKGQFFTELEELKLVNLKNQGLTLNQICEKLGRSKSSVSHKCKVLREKGILI